MKKKILQASLGILTASILGMAEISLTVLAEPVEYDYLAEQTVAEEAARIAAEQAAAEEAARIAAEQAAAEEAARIEAEHAAAEEAARQAAEQAAAEEAERQAAEQAAAEEAARRAQEAAEAQAQAAAEEAARQEQERLQAEQAAAQQQMQTLEQESETTTQAQTTVGAMNVVIASQIPRYIAQNASFELHLRITGGKAPYRIQSGDNPEAATASEEGDTTVPTIMTTIGRDRILDIRVTDADGTTAVLQASLPVTGSKMADWDVINTIMGQVSLKETWAENLLIIARSQLGTAESIENFIIDEQGRFFGYTQYGLWQNSYYEEWSAGFLDFCFYYAKIEETMFPYAATASEWPMTVGENYKTATGEYTPKAGDIIFLHVTDSRQEESPLTVINHVGIITAVTDDTIATIEGNVGGSVKECLYTKDSNGAFADAARGGIVLGYADIAQAEQDYREKLTLEEDQEENGEDAEEMTEAGEEGTPAESEAMDDSEEALDETAEERIEEDENAQQTGLPEVPDNDTTTEMQEAEEPKAEEETKEDPEETSGKEATDTEYLVEAEGMLFTIIPKEPEVMPEGTTVRIEFLDEQESQTLAAELLEPMARENQKIEVRQARSMRIMFIDSNGNEFRPATTIKVSMTEERGQEE